MKKNLRSIVNFLVVKKVSLLNSKASIGKNCRIEWNVKFKGVNPIVVGDNTDIRDGAILIPHCGSIRIGKNSSIGAYNILDGSGGLIIGDEVRIGSHVCIYSANHLFSDKNKPIYLQGLSLREVVINRDVWIGAHTTILPGVTINSGSVIAAGSIVVKDVPKNVVVGGNPAKILKNR